MLITALIQGKKEAFVNLYLDDQFAAGITKNTLIEFALYKGKFIDETTWTEILEKDSITRLYLKAYAYLLIRPRSQGEIETFLQAKTSKTIEDTASRAHIVSKVIEKLIEQKLIDDHAFASWWVENRNAFRSRSSTELKRELQLKRVPSAIIDTVIKQEVTIDNQVEMIRATAKKRLRVDDLNFLKQDRKSFTKITQYFMRRGFSYNLIKQALFESQNL